MDIFAGCLDQVGLDEMKNLVNQTGGYMVLADSFTTSIFRQSFQRMFEKDEAGNLNMGFNADLEVLCTSHMRVCGMIGHLVSENKKTQHVDETVAFLSATK